MPSGITPNLGLTLPSIAGDAFVWGNAINNDLLIIDGMIGPFAGDFRFLPNDGTSGRTEVVFANAPGGIIVMPFIMDRYFNVNKFGLSITVPDIGKFAYAGLYTLGGNLITFGKFPLDDTGAFTVVSQIAKLSPGPYFVAVAADSATAQATGYGNSTAFYPILPGGVAANPIVGGVMPPTLGVVTGPLILSTPTPVMLS